MSAPDDSAPAAMTTDHERARANLGRGEFWRWRADVVDVVDGDTLKVELDLGLGLRLSPVTNVYVTRVRFLGYDAPEIATPEGKEARNALVGLMGVAPDLVAVRVFVNSAALDGRGRILGTVDLVDGRSVIDEMVKLGWLRPYNGRGPHPW